MFENLSNSGFEQKCNMFFNLYNRCAKLYGFRKAIKLTAQRRKAMHSITECSRSDLALLIIEIRKAKAFFQGSDWFDFDWIIQEGNYVKVMEGKYSKSFNYKKQQVIKTRAEYREQVF
jgi:hypothetical protein